MLIRTWSKPEILQHMAWLKRENAKGADVYVRPAGETNAGLVLVDDLNRGQLARMQAAGMVPASVTETSPDNFQAWVRVHEKHLEPKLATEVATMLAKEYGGDPNSADWRHFGRLAGLTNAKHQHKDANGRSPYVLAHESGGKLAPAGVGLVQQAAQRILDREARNDQRSRLEAAQEAAGGPRMGDPIHTYRYGLKSLHTRFGASMDLSRADYMIGVDMVLKGFKPDQVAKAIEQASPELPIRKAGHEGDYVARTVAAIMASPKVTEWQQEQAQRRSRSGPSLGR
ncbi:DNA-primase RepB domain-containing protein [Xylella fastidiosa]